MKRTWILLALTMMVTTFVQAQQDDAGQLFRDLAGGEHCTVLTIPGGAIRLAASLQQDEPEVKDLLEKISSVRIFAAEHTGDAFFDKMSLELQKNYDELMTVEREGEQVKFLIHGDGETVRELLLLTTRGKAATMILVRGKMNLSEMARMKNSTRHEGGLSFLTAF